MLNAAPVPTAAPAPTGGAQAVDRALALLAAVGRAPPHGVSLADLAASGGIAKPTARRLLISLLAAGLVEQDAASRYHLGAGAFLLGVRAGRRHDMQEIAADCVARLADLSGDSAFLLVPQGDEALCLIRHEGSWPIRTHALLPGDRNPLGVGAGGLALLAALPPAESDVSLERLRPALLARMGDAAEDVPQDVTRARQLGYAINPGRVVAGSWGIGVAVLWPDGRPAAALTIAAVESRMSHNRQQELAKIMQTEAALIEGRLARHLTPSANRRERTTA